VPTVRPATLCLAINLAASSTPSPPRRTSLVEQTISDRCPSRFIERICVPGELPFLFHRLHGTPAGGVPCRTGLILRGPRPWEISGVHFLSVFCQPGATAVASGLTTTLCTRLSPRGAQCPPCNIPPPRKRSGLSCQEKCAFASRD